MVKNSTLFFFYNDLNKEIELYENEELTESNNLFKDELKEIFGGINFQPRQEVLDEIFNETLN